MSARFFFRVMPLLPLVAAASMFERSAAQSNEAPQKDEQPQGAAGTGVSGTNATGDTGKSEAGAHGTGVITQPDAKPAVPPMRAAPVGDEKAGADIIAHGVTDKGAPPCLSCHGPSGEGNAATGFPRLAGLPAEYIRKQLDDYASGTRNQPIMTPIAKALDETQRSNVAATYASTIAKGAAPVEKSQTSDRARTLATLGDEKLRVQACANCHGPDGAGLSPSYPPLAGQYQKYLTGVLGEWRNGNRNNDPSGQMPGIARALSESDIAALAAMYAGLPPADSQRE